MYKCIQNICRFFTGVKSRNNKDKTKHKICMSIKKNEIILILSEIKWKILIHSLGLVLCFLLQNKQKHSFEITTTSDNKIYFWKQK